MMKVHQFTISHSVDSYKAGGKSSTLVSANVVLEEPVEIEDFARSQLKASEEVYIACVYNALAKQQIDKIEASRKITECRERTRLMYDAIVKKNSVEEIGE